MACKPIRRYRKSLNKESSWICDASMAVKGGAELHSSVFKGLIKSQASNNYHGSRRDLTIVAAKGN